jgi:protocatechuate 3,4-dioxygenase beta subunit
MTWQITALNWLVYAALSGSLFLAAGCLAVHWCRQPVRRIRLIELTLVGAVLVPWVNQLSWMPHWSSTWAILQPVLPPPAMGAEVVAGTEAFPPLVSTPVSRAEPIGQPSIQAGELAPHSPPASAPALVAPAPVRGWSIYELILAAYALLTATVLAWWLLGLVQLWLLIQRTYPVPQHVADLFRTISGAGPSRVRLLASARLELPLTFTGWYPVIVLPGSMCDTDSASLRYCLAHEWSHVERGDSWRWYLAGMAQFLFFYQPLFWWLRRQLRLCQDYLADARAVEQAAEAEDYAAYLVELARRHVSTPLPALGIGDRRSNLYRRITMLLYNPEPLERRCVLAWTLGVSLAALGLLALCSTVRLDAGAPRAEATKDAAPETPQAPAKTEQPKGELLHYTGTVTDKDTGKPIAGAVVTVRRSLYGDPTVKPSEQIVQETKHTTDASGKYSFTIPPEQTAKRHLYIELDVEHADYAPRNHFGYALAMIRKNEKMGERPFFEHVELRPGKAITGLVQTPEGKPASGVKVLAYSVTSKKQEHEFEYGSFADCKTDAQGRFRLVLTTPGAAVFWLLPEEYAPSTHPVKNDKRGELGSFTLGNGIRLRGKVLDAKGKPLGGVIVNAEATERNEDLQGLMVADQINRSALTNDSGEFETAPLPPGTYRVHPDEHVRDGSKKPDRDRHKLPAVFVVQNVHLQENVDPIEIRAVPHVTIEAQYVDSKGKPTRGHECFIHGMMNKTSWFSQGQVDANGKIVIQIPHGLQTVKMSLSTNEHSSLRHRKTRDEPLSNAHDIDLGTVNDDIKGIEIVRYTAPILLINAVDPDGRQVKGFRAQVVYSSGNSPKQPGSFFVNGVQGDVYLEKQDDGRWRTSQLLPDQEVTVTVSAEGHQARSEKLTPREGETKELRLVLEKSSEKKETRK